MKTTIFLIAACAALIGAGAYAANPDENPAQVKSCDSDKLRNDVGELSGVSWEDEAAICREMASSLGRLPPVGLLRILGKVTFILRTAGGTETPKDIAFQVMNVVEARSQTSNVQINETFETLVKIYNGSNGRVTPKDMNLNLRSMGSRAKKINRQGMFSMAAILLENKKSGH